MGNKHRKLFVIGQSKGCKFLPQMHRNTFGSRALSGPAVGAYALARPLAAMGGAISKGKGGTERKGRGLFRRGTEREEMEFPSKSR